MTKEDIVLEHPEVAFWKKELDGINKVIESQQESMKVNELIKESFESKLKEVEANIDK